MRANTGSQRRVAPGRSCLECRRRKIACDRSHPCSYCVKVKIRCTYPQVLASASASTSNDGGGNAFLQDRIDGIDDRLKMLEQSMSEIKDILLETRSPPQFPFPRQDDFNQGIPEIFPDTQEQTTRHRQNHSWTIFDQSVGQQTLDLSPMLLFSLWQRYLERVDPLIKLFHTPSAQKIFMDGVTKSETSNLNALCLVHAVYYSAIMSMSPAECDAELQNTKDVLLERSRNSMELSLSAIDVLNTRDVIVLQALTLYLICGRLDLNGPNVHREVGMAIGIAMKMNLNRDGYALGLNPFETEIRRRLWWNILTLDALTAQDHKTDPCALGKSFNTKVPSNVNDSELDPNMSSPPANQQQTSGMVFTLARIEITFYSRQFVFSDQFCRENSYPELSAVEKRHTLEMMKTRIEDEYLKLYDESIPLHSIAASATRLILLKLRLSISDTDHGGLGDLTEDWESYCAQVDALKSSCHKGQQFLWFFTDLLNFSPAI